MTDDVPSKLRQRLRRKISELEDILRAGFDTEPLLPANLHVSKHRCGKAGCRCNRPEGLHEALRLQIRFKDGIANRCISEEESGFWRPRTEAYRRLRDARRRFGKWYRGVVEILDAIERARRSLEGLSDEDGKRPLR